MPGRSWLRRGLCWTRTRLQHWLIVSVACAIQLVSASFSARLLEKAFLVLARLLIPKTSVARGEHTQVWTGDSVSRRSRVGILESTCSVLLDFPKLRKGDFYLNKHHLTLRLLALKCIFWIWTSQLKPTHSNCACLQGTKDTSSTSMLPKIPVEGDMIGRIIADSGHHN